MALNLFLDLELGFLLFSQVGDEKWVSEHQVGNGW